MKLLIYFALGLLLTGCSGGESNNSSSPNGEASKTIDTKTSPEAPQEVALQVEEPKDPNIIKINGRQYYSHEYFKNLELVGVNLSMKFDEAALILEEQGFVRPRINAFSMPDDPTNTTGSNAFYETSTYAFEKGEQSVFLFRYLMPDGSSALREIRFTEDFGKDYRIVSQFLDRMVDRFGEPSTKKLNERGEPDRHSAFAEWGTATDLRTDINAAKSFSEAKCFSLEDQLQSGCPESFEDRVYARKQINRRNSSSGIDFSVRNGLGSYSISLSSSLGAADTRSYFQEKRRNEVFKLRSKREKNEAETDPF